ncbi:MAG: protein kinase [Proteobacteria bacterium]|nr:protein kinase [Pseudomonadota bacterium]
MGERFGKYELVRRIGVGGMAEVHVARAFGAEGFVKDVVIKRILPALNADREFVDMFINEARVAARLHHANIVQVIEFDQVDGVYYIAMEWVDGTDLRHVRSLAHRRRLPIPQTLAVHVGVEALKGLHFAHGKIEHGRPLGLVHRDISPHNLLLSFAGELRIADFGIAKAAALASVTRTGAVKGKLTYMAPEQLRGEVIDQRTDLYALGIVLWELLSDRRLYGASGSEGELVAAVRRGGAPPLCTVAPAVPAALGAVIDRLLAPAPEDRFGSAAEVLPALSRFASTGDALAVAEYLRRLLPAEAERDHRGVTVPQGAVLTTDMPLAGPDAATHSATPGVETGPPRPAPVAAQAGVLQRGLVPVGGPHGDQDAATSAPGVGALASGATSDSVRTWRLRRGPVLLAVALVFGGILASTWWLGARWPRRLPNQPLAPIPTTVALLVTLDPPQGELEVDGVELGSGGRWTLTGRSGHRARLVARWPQGSVVRQVVFGGASAELRLAVPAALALASAPRSVDASAGAARPPRVVARSPAVIPAEALAARRPPASPTVKLPTAGEAIRAAGPTPAGPLARRRPRPAGASGSVGATRRAVLAPATLDVIVVPWARVVLDGRPVGTTPLTGLSAAAGPHLVELGNDDLERHERIRLRLRAGEHRRLRRDWTASATAGAASARD